MIWNTAALTLLLATSAAAVSKKTLMKEMEARHRNQIKVIQKKMKTARKLTGTEKARALADNSGFANYKYYADSSCSNDPYGYAGYGLNSCIPDGGGEGSFKLTGCTGSGASIDVTVLTYDSNDCSGDVAETLAMNFDGTCAVADDDLNIDSRAENDDVYVDTSEGYMELSCDTTMNEPTWYLKVAFDDSDCSTVTMYYGFNQDSCLPVTDGGAYALLDGCELDKITLNSDCTGEDVRNDDEDDEGGDDDEDFGAGKCYAFPADADDEYAYPGTYYTSENFCKNDDSDSNGDDDCFAGSETVLLQSGVSKAIMDVAVGDVVQVVGADGRLKFSEVVFLPHGANTKETVFTELQMLPGNSLRATADHLVMNGPCGADAFEMTAMKNVPEGSCVQTTSGPSEVTGSALVVDYGVYTIVTKETSGLVVVNGVYASSFAHNHWLVNHYYNIHRAVYEFAPSLLKNRDVVAANLIVGDLALSVIMQKAEDHWVA